MEGRGIDMSYDIYVEETHSNWVGNITSNVGGMYQLAFDSKEGIKILDGRECKECLPFIDEAIDYFEKFDKTLKKLNPENGWGSYETALKFLKEVKLFAEDYPKRYFSVSY